MARHFKLVFVVLAAMALLLPTSQARDDSGKASPALAERPVAARRLPSAQEIASLENQLGYKFTNTFTLTQALLHPSFGELNNARLSWLGDAVLGMVVSDRLYHCLPSNATTEDLHERRVAEVSRKACAIRAHKMGLDKLLVVGKGYEGQVPTQAMLAECYEAVWGAIYQDSNCQLEKVKAAYDNVDRRGKTALQTAAA